MRISLHYTCSSHIVQSICNICEIANRKTRLQFENIDTLIVCMSKAAPVLPRPGAETRSVTPKRNTGEGKKGIESVRLGTFAPIATEHPYCARKFTRHFIHRARALYGTMNNDKEDGHRYNFARISRSWIFSSPYISLQKQIFFTMIYTLFKNEQKVSVGSSIIFNISVHGTSNQRKFHFKDLFAIFWGLQTLPY